MLVRLEPAVRVRTLSHDEMVVSDLTADLGPCSQDGACLRCVQSERPAGDTLPERIGPIDQFARVVERDQRRCADARARATGAATDSVWASGNA